MERRPQRERRLIDEYREAIRAYRGYIGAYAEREYDILAARFRGQLTDTEYIECRALAFFAHGYTAHARRWWRRHFYVS